MIAAMTSPVMPKTAGVVVASSGQIAGSATNQSGGAPVAGGIVWLFAAGETDLGPGSALDTAVVDGSGDYLLAGLDPGDYDVLYNPPLTMCLGDSEPHFQSVTVVNGQTTTQDFVAQAVVYSDDFSYDSDTDYTGCGSNSGPNGCFFDNNITGGNPGGHDGTPGGGAFGHTVTRTLNGPGGSPVMTYTWGADPNPGFGCSDSQANSTVNMAPRFNKYGAFGDEFWFSFYQAESADFVNGRNTCAGSSREYKYLIVDFNTNPYGNVQQLWFEWENFTVGAPGPDDYLLRIKLTTNSGSTVVAETTGGGFGGDYALGAGFLANFHRWTVGITGVQDATQDVTVYLDGIPVRTLTGAWLTGRDYQHADAIVTFQIGANINNGPTTGGMQRYFREWNVARRRPTLVQDLAV